MKKRVLLLVLAVLALMFVLVSCGHKHDFKQSEVITEATCDAAGKAKFVCECGESEEREIAAKGHTFGEEQVKEPTCWEDGYTYKVCSVCNAESEPTNTVKADSKYHKFDEVKMTTEVDCGKQQDGIRQTVCSICHKPDPNGKVEQIKWAHEWEETTVEATCKAPGSISQACKTCGAPGQVTILEQLPHTEEKTGSTPANCLEAGFDSFKCTVCESTWDVPTDDALGHDIDTENKLTQDPTCLLDGYDYYACTRCDYREREAGINGEALGHDYDYETEGFIIVVDATCITDGSITPICKREGCGEVLTSEVEVIKATGVHYTTDKEISSKEATCHEAAYVEYQCTADDACTATEKRYSGEKLEHNLVFIKTVAPKCNAPGYDLYVCTLCEENNTETSKCVLGCVEHRNEKIVPHQPTINKTKDAEGNPIEFVPATCIKNAYTIWECGDCSQEWTYTYTVEEKPLMQHGVDADGNDCWQPTNTVVAPTCSAEGYTIYFCPNDDDCTETTKKDFTRRTEHPFTEYIDGRLVCSACNVTYRDITTYIDKAVDSGELEIDDNTKLNWELKGYENPKDPTALVANTAYVYEVKDGALDISVGIIKLSSENEATYTIVVEYGDGETKTYNVDSAKAYFDLYENSKVTKVTITATADATVSLYAYEG